MEELRGVELLPEPGEPKILSAVDPSTSGHEGQWRAEVTGWAPVVPDTVPYRPRRVFSLASGLIVALFMGIIVVLWQSDLLLLQLPPPTSEWAFEDAEIRELQEVGLTGEGVRVCMVDTDFINAQLISKRRCCVRRFCWKYSNSDGLWIHCSWYTHGRDSVVN